MRQHIILLFRFMQPGPLFLAKLFMKAAGFDVYDPNVANYEVVYLNGEERRRRGPQGYESANVFGAKSVKGFARIMFGNDRYSKNLYKHNVVILKCTMI